MLPAIDLTGSKDEIEAILKWAKNRPEIDETSEPTALDATRALNVGLPEITEALTFLTLVFTTGKAALEFLKALRDEIKTHKTSVIVSDTLSGTPLGKLDGGTSDSEISSLTLK